MKIRVVEFRHVYSNPGLWLFLFTVDSMLFMLGLVYCLQNGVFALIAIFPLILYALTAWLYERTRRRAPSLLVDIDSIKWRTGPKDKRRVRFRTVESIEYQGEEDDFALVLKEKDGARHVIAIPGLESRRGELERVLRKKAKEYEFFAQ
ncbi:hypothetical protein SAMN02745216_01879 [Desulfatibacillum alkenivorans DSM 16219]|jgi:hypothetical protein|uniref:Uncharacterized protein n=1 Tax=Desulfatibacillum alkenivorans DSM 16219 TaxID=1121393 RepID=A0A1M6KF20_9BACT|nr:hypothetical protein [Desulfatibacillum alkenivorans]SHJ57457.1 hypothetical protein SAMN02745216_01879 [Desulfatibacillum alkenivorans DSM 16219]